MYPNKSEGCGGVMNHKLVIMEKCPLILEKIFSKPWILILFFLPFFKPVSFEYIGVPFVWIDTLLTVLKAGIALFACLVYLYEKKFSSLAVCTGILSAIVLFSTLINAGNIKEALVQVVNILGIYILTELAARHSFQNLLRSLYYLLSILLVLHLASQFIFPNGMALNEYYNYKVYFMNIDNLMAPLVFLAMLVTILYSEYVYQRITWPAVGMLAVSSAIIVKSWAASALVGWFIFLVFLVFFYRRKLGRFFKFHYLAAAYVVIFFSVVVFRLQNLFSFIIVDILHKDLTFTHRTEFWDIAYSLIGEHWLVGLGVPLEKGHIQLPSFNNLYYYGHNIIIEILLVGGVLLLAAFLIALFFSGRKVMSVKNHPWAALISALLFSFFIVMLMESYYQNSAFWAMLAIAFSLPSGIAEAEKFQRQNPHFGERKGSSLKLHQFFCEFKQKMARSKK